VKVVIQCSATKAKNAGTFQVNGRTVRFVAHPELCQPNTTEIFAHPDDHLPSGGTTWREHLEAYNRGKSNLANLLRAGDLYTPNGSTAYQLLLQKFGYQDVYILSAGWGLIRADYLIPDYDITFAKHKKIGGQKKRGKKDSYQDLAQLTAHRTSEGELVYFFGGLDYLPLFLKLTDGLDIWRRVYFTTTRADKLLKAERCCYIKYSAKREQNWHYDCVEENIDKL